MKGRPCMRGRLEVNVLIFEPAGYVQHLQEDRHSASNSEACHGVGCL